MILTYFNCLILQKHSGLYFLRVQRQLFLFLQCLHLQFFLSAGKVVYNIFAVLFGTQKETQNNVALQCGSRRQ